MHKTNAITDVTKKQRGDGKKLLVVTFPVEEQPLSRREIELIKNFRKCDSEGQEIWCGAIKLSAKRHEQEVAANRRRVGLRLVKGGANGWPRC